MRNERLERQSMRRVMREHELSSRKCIEKSESAAVCIQKTGTAIEMAKEIPKPYIRQKRQLDKTCDKRINKAVTKKQIAY